MKAKEYVAVWRAAKDESVEDYLNCHLIICKMIDEAIEIAQKRTGDKKPGDQALLAVMVEFDRKWRAIVNQLPEAGLAPNGWVQFWGAQGIVMPGYVKEAPLADPDLRAVYDTKLHNTRSSE